MCGIFGVVYRDGTTVPALDRLKATTELLQHRGPDSAGVYQQPGIGLAHTRLSLVDLNERSGQPFWDPTGRYGLVYNGEIYNFRELRRSLEARQIQFRTTSDTEVLLHSLIVEGPKATLAKLEGMFAFAFFDKQEKRVILARDRFGIKPLLIYQDDSLVLFASEVKAMRPWVELEPNPFSITSFLLGSYGPAQNACFYKDVTILPPGTLLSLRIGEKPQTERYIGLADMIDPEQGEELRRLKDTAVVDLMDEMLQRSVRQVQFADATVGALCSGGVDSSVLMAIAARDNRNLQIFHADVNGPASEYEAAHALSKHLRLELKKVDVKDQHFVDLFPDVIYHYEHPFFRHPHSIAFMMVSRLARENGVKGVLTGEGSDECFLGYQHVVQNPIRVAARRLPALVRRIPRIGWLLAPGEDPSRTLVANMLNGFERPVEEEELREAHAAATGVAGSMNVQSLELMTYHLRTLLHRNDSMGMSASIEARFPFLSESFVKTAINLPVDKKVRFSPRVWQTDHPFQRDKWVLRKVADRYLPRSLSQRKKWPFTVKAFDRMKIPSAYFEKSFVADYFKLAKPELDYLLDNADQKLRIKLLMLNVWGDVCLGIAPPEATRRQLQTHLSFRN